MDADSSALVAFQPGLVDEPAGRQLHPAGASRRRVNRHVGPLGLQLPRHALVHDRVFEEAACVARHLRIGKFGAADRADRFADVAQRDTAAGFDLALHVAVAQPRPRRARKPDVHGRDDDAPPQFVLEDAFAVAEAAVSGVDDHCRAVVGAEHVHPLDHVFGFAAVGADVLHRGRARLAGYERKVFDAPQAAFHGPFHEVVPLDARIGPHADRVALFAEGRDLPGDGRKQQSVVVAREEDVVAAAQHRPAFGHAAAEDRSQVLFGLEFGETRRLLSDAEAVASAQVDLVEFSDHAVCLCLFVVRPVVSAGVGRIMFSVRPSRIPASGPYGAPGGMSVPPRLLVLRRPVRSRVRKMCNLAQS